jgi:hypothetical protein
MMKVVGEKPMFPNARHFLWGAFGGITPVVAALIVSEGHPFTTYLALLDTGPAVVKSMFFYVFQTGALFTLGGVWAYLNNAADPMKAFQLGVAAPAVIVGMLAVNDAKKATASDPLLRPSALVPDPTSPPLTKRVVRAIVPLPTSDLFIRTQFSSAPVAESLPIEDLPRLFPGVERRLASDKLISEYPNNKQAVIKALIAAIQPGDQATSYRVNIYVARTLRLIPGKWEGTEAQRDAIKNLTSQTNYKDQTFKENVDGALANWKLAQG